MISEPCPKLSHVWKIAQEWMA